MLAPLGPDAAQYTVKFAELPIGKKIPSLAKAIEREGHNDHHFYLGQNPSTVHPSDALGLFPPQCLRFHGISSRPAGPGRERPAGSDRMAAVAAAMLSVLVIMAVVLLHREAKSLGISLWSRMCLKRPSLKDWGLSIILIVLGLAATVAVQPLVPLYMKAAGLAVPGYMPFFLNPGINPATADAAAISPGLLLRGSYGLLPLVGIALLLNILAEELYFRAWMLPKLARYRTWGWIMNGAFFALYHTFQIWLLPVLLVASLFFAFIFYRTKSIWPPFAAHLAGNLLFSMIGILMLIIG